MRVVLAALLTIGLGASQLLAGATAETGKEETPTAVTSASASAEKSKEAAKPENSALESEIQDLRSMIEEQRAELEAQRAALETERRNSEAQRTEFKAQQMKMEALVEKLGAAASAPEPILAAASPVAAEPASISASISSTMAVHASPAANSPQKGGDEDSPLQFKIGSAYFTPVGFMDFTGVFRSHDEGTGIGTNFAGIKYGNTFNTHLGEFRESMQNSRIGFRIDAMVKGAHVIGYMESDYLGNNGGNVAVSSNSNTLRSRLYWVDVQKDKWELLGGQTWSLITPGRSGISPLPANIFFSQDIDVNYQAGLVWGRIPELRFVVRPTSKVAFAVAIDSPEQYAGGSAGGATIVYPAALGTFGGTQLDTGGTTLSTPNPAPDFITKLAYDPSSRLHFEAGGLVRDFKVWNSLPAPSGTSFSKIGTGAFFNFNVEVFKGFRILSNDFWADGGGRYIFGQVPDVIVRADNTLSPVKAASTVSGFEYTHRNSLLYAYYGGIYAYRNLALDTNGLTLIGYGVPYAVASSSSQNRMVNEETIGFNQTLWKDGRYGALNFMGQYSYVSRKFWATLNPSDAHVNMVFLNLRYTLPGSAPTLGK
jgi:hypothetical protein